MKPIAIKSIPPLDAAIVLEFRPSSTADIDAICRLAEAVPARLIVVAQEITPTQNSYLAAHFAHLENVVVYDVGAPLGRGAAIRLGLQYVNEVVVAILTLDFDVDYAQLREMLQLLHESPALDGLMAVRTRRTLLGHVYNTFANVLFDLQTRDVQAPLKVFRTQALRSILDRLQLFGHGFDADLMFRVRRQQLLVREVPAKGIARPASWPFITTGTRALLALASLRILESRFGNNPIAMRLGRPYWLAPKASYSILIFCWRDPRSPKAGGGEVYLHEQARCWVRQGHKVTWVSQHFRKAAREETLDGIEIIRRGRSLFVFPAAAFWYIARSGWRFDFILDVMNGMPFFTPLFSSKPKCCLLYHVHSHHFRQELPRPLSDFAVAVETKLVPWVYRRTRFLTISESSACEMRDLGITRLPLEIIHSGVTDDMQPGAKHIQPTILYLGRLRRYKGVRKLIDAFKTLRTAIPNARLVVAGTGDDEVALRQYARGIPGIEFTGAVDEATKVRLFQEAWVFGMPSTLEGWGIVVIEAARCGTPAVAYDVNGLRDCILPGETGMLAHNDFAFVDALRVLLLNYELRERMSKNAIAWGDQYSWDRTAQRTLSQIRRAQPWNAVFAREGEAELPSFLNDLERPQSSGSRSAMK